MVHARNTAAFAEGEDDIDVQIAENGTVDKEEIFSEETVAVSQTTSEEGAPRDAMSITEL